MPTFTYKAISADKRVSEGSLSSQNREEAAQILVKRGLSPLVVKEVLDKSIVRGTVPLIEKITFCRHLSVMLSTGLALSEGIEVLREETRHPLMKRILGDMMYSLEQGQQLSVIFERYPEVFESYFLTLTRAGEVSGKLADIFHYLEAELRAEYNLTSKVKGALLYPAIVFIAMIFIGIIMFFFVLPQIGKVFLSLHLPLPAFTQFMFTFSIALSAQTVPIVVGLIVVSVGVVIAFRNKQVRRLFGRMISPIPLVRNLIKKVDLARFSRIFATLLRSAVPITEALEISLTSLSWFEFHDLAAVIPNEIRKGKALSGVMKEKKIFPSLMIQMVAAGEKTATLDTTLNDVAGFYEQEVEEELRNLTTILEPLLMLLVGITVGIMILSIVAPIYSVVGSFQDSAQPR